MGSLLVLILGIAGARAAQAAAPVVPPDAEIRRILAERMGAAEGAGIVVGVVSPTGRRIISYGQSGKASPRPLDGDSVFEIGSVTKAFTALLLADMVQRGEIALADPVAKHLPAGVKLPERSGRAITLVDLATHTSGLPFMPDEATVSANSAAQLYQYLAAYELRRDIGAEWDYSNVGYWLLGEALAVRAAMDFESLVRTRVLQPLQLKDTAITPSPQMRARLAVGHDASLQPAPAVSTLPGYAVMPAAGALLSTADDLSRFLAAALGYESSPLAPAMASMVSTRRPMSSPVRSQALGWTVEGEGADTLIFHDGGTLGFASAVAWDPRQRVGVVVLSNQIGDVADIARHLLRPEVPLAKPTVITQRKEIALDPAVLDAYAGRYEADGEGIFLVAGESDHLTIQFPAAWGLPKLRLRAESRSDFFVAELPLRVTFQMDDGARVSGVLIYPPRGKQAVPATRLKR